MPPKPAVSTGGLQHAVWVETAPDKKSSTVPTWRSLRAGEVSRFRSEGLVVENKEWWCFTDLSVPSVGKRVLVGSRPF